MRLQDLQEARYAGISRIIEKIIQTIDSQEEWDQKLSTSDVTHTINDLTRIYGEPEFNDEEGPVWKVHKKYPGNSYLVYLISVRPNLDEYGNGRDVIVQMEYEED